MEDREALGRQERRHQDRMLREVRRNKVSKEAHRHKARCNKEAPRRTWVVNREVHRSKAAAADREATMGMAEAEDS